eukprot:11199513-Lingulodinium_polyedra.AAC.1
MGRAARDAVALASPAAWLRPPACPARLVSDGTRGQNLYTGRPRRPEAWPSFETAGPRGGGQPKGKPARAPPPLSAASP